MSMNTSTATSSTTTPTALKMRGSEELITNSDIVQTFNNETLEYQDAVSATKSREMAFRQYINNIGSIFNSISRMRSADESVCRLAGTIMTEGRLRPAITYTSGTTDGVARIFVAGLPNAFKAVNEFPTAANLNRYVRISGEHLVDSNATTFYHFTVSNSATRPLPYHFCALVDDTILIGDFMGMIPAAPSPTSPFKAHIVAEILASKSLLNRLSFSMGLGAPGSRCSLLDFPLFTTGELAISHAQCARQVRAAWFYLAQLSRYFGEYHDPSIDRAMAAFTELVTVLKNEAFVNIVEFTPGGRKNGPTLDGYQPRSSGATESTRARLADPFTLTSSANRVNVTSTYSVLVDGANTTSVTSHELGAPPAMNLENIAHFARDHFSARMYIGEDIESPRRVATRRSAPYCGGLPGRRLRTFFRRASCQASSSVVVAARQSVLALRSLARLTLEEPDVILSQPPVAESDSGSDSESDSGRMAEVARRIARDADLDQLFEGTPQDEEVIEGTPQDEEVIERTPQDEEVIERTPEAVPRTDSEEPIDRTPIYRLVLVVRDSDAPAEEVAPEDELIPWTTDPAEHLSEIGDEAAEARVALTTDVEETTPRERDPEDFLFADLNGDGLGAGVVGLFDRYEPLAPAAAVEEQPAAARLHLFDAYAEQPNGNAEQPNGNAEQPIGNAEQPIGMEEAVVAVYNPAHAIAEGEPQIDDLYAPEEDDLEEMLLRMARPVRTVGRTGAQRMGPEELGMCWNFDQSAQDWIYEEPEP